MSLSFVASVQNIQGGAQFLNSLLLIALGLTTLCSLVRLLLRYRSKSFGVDDIFLLVSQISFGIFSAFTFLSVQHGISSRPEDNNDGNTLSAALRYWFFSDLLYIIAVSFLRLAACLQLRKFATSVDQKWYLCWATLFTTAYGVVYFYLVLFKCEPVDYFWTGWLGASGQCTDVGSVANAAYGFAGMSTISNIAMAVMPVWLMRGENQKLGFCAKVVVGMGISTGLISLARIQSIAFLKSSNDFFLDCVPITVCSILEIAMGIMAVSLASFGRLMPSRSQPILVANACPTTEKSDSKTETKFLSYRDLSSMTGLHVSPFKKGAILRKISERNVSIQ